METPARDAASLVQAAKDLGTQIRQHRTEIERERTLPASLVTAMTGAGSCSLWLSRAFGGPELDFTGFAQVIEELSRADGSVGWCAMVASVFSRLSGYLGSAAGAEIFRGGTARLAGSLSPTGKAVAVAGGFRVSGRWSYGSFIQHSHWAVGNSIVHDGDTPRRDSHGAPDIRFMIFPTAAAEIIDNWNVYGLRGTGSHDFQVHELFVPEHHTLSAFAARPVHPGTLYATPMITIFAASIACVSIGIARAAVEAFVALAEAKTPTGSAVRLRDKAMAQVAVGRAEALLLSGRAFLLQSVEEIWNDVSSGKTPTLRQRAVARLAAAKAAETSAQAVDLLFNAAGGSALFESSPLERCFRDVHATTQHIGTQESNYELAGRVLLGLDPGTPRF
jgi:alkylation response protein AidB-like acyl-CoA dehydrogenase